MKKQMPCTISKYANSWGIQVKFETSPSDRIYFTNYSPSTPMYDKSGFHTVNISDKNENGNGYREIGYLYITGYFGNSDQLNIKVPLAIC